MAKRPENSPEPSYGDSRLAEFLRRAKPILAAERGMTPQSRIKLKALADELHLPLPLFETAIGQLQGSAANAQVELTRYERQFVRFLEKQLEPLIGNVLTPSHEKWAIGHGESDFQIEHDRARDLVRQVANRMGIGRVSRLDAAEHVARLIDETIGQATTANATVRERIQKSAKRWGVDSKQAQILIDNRLTANLQSMRPRSSIWIILLAVFASVMVLALLVWVLSTQFAKSGKRQTPSTDNLSDSSEVSVNSRTAADAIPDFWRDETQRAWQELLANDRTNSVPRHLAFSVEVTDRQLAIAPIVNLALGETELIRDSAGQFLVQVIADDREISEVAIKTIAARLRIDRVSDSLTLRSLEEAFRAADLLHRCREQSVDLVVREQIDKAFAMTINASGNPGAESPQISANTQLTRLAWQRLDRLASHDTETAARLYSQVLKLTQPQSRESLSLAWPVGLKIFFANGEGWQLMREAWQVAFTSASDDQLFQAFDLLTPETDIDRTAWLLFVLAERLGIDQVGRSFSQISDSIRARFGLTSETWKPASARWELLVDLPDFRAAIEPVRQPTPQSIANVAWLSTAAFLMWQAEQQTNPRFLDLFDQIIADGPRVMSIRSQPVRNWQSLPVYGRVKRRPLPSDIEARRTALEKLENPTGLSSIVLAAALERLGNIADRFADVSPGQATSIVRFMLHASDDPEVVAVERFTPRFRHWANLATALSEQVLEPDVSIDQAVTIASLLMELNFEPGDATNWRKELHRALLRQLADGLQHTAEIQGDHTDYQWDELHDYMVELGRIRCQATGIANRESSAIGSPAELTRLVVRQLIGDDPRLVTTRMLADDDLQETILTTMLLTDVIKRGGQSTDETDKSTTAVVDCPTVLLTCEQNLLLALVRQREEK